MKKIFIPLSLVLLTFVFACSNSSKEKKDVTDGAKWSSYGDTITADNAVEAADLTAKLTGHDSLNVKLHAKVDEVCQKKGCWMTIPVGDKSMRVHFKDYGFFMPKDCSGKEVIFEGKAFYDTTTVEMLQHYAKDGGKSAKEIAKITEPEIDLSFEAHGVLLKDGE
ncbi:MAG: DUF4920 domain-containing protein [Sphingobacteriales bacterium]|nr:MAG: DUF4920 domain-containing protein [Sphingobacteriales bacterium]